uniref:Uncharacterized protein n=1 Tax=Strongyloides venezuelensis TaxID=75913 RepID=A0A0K0F123_STRVS
MIHLSLSRSTSSNLFDNSDEDSDKLSLNKRSLPFGGFYNNILGKISSLFDLHHNDDEYEKSLTKELDEIYGHSSNVDIKENKNNNEEDLVGERQPESNINVNSQYDNEGSQNEDMMNEQDSSSETRVYDLRPRLTTINYKE